MKRNNGKRNLLPARPAAAGSEHTAASPAPSLKLKRILVPTDFSKASVEALRYAVAFATQFGASISLLHVIEQAAFLNDLYNVPLSKSPDEIAAHAKHALVSLARRHVGPAIPTLSRVRVGKAFQEIATAARVLHADLIIIATHGRTGLKRVLLGSTAEWVVRHAPCPVLVVRGR